MSLLAKTIAGKILERIQHFEGGSEIRLIFHGPPVEILSDVFKELAGNELQLPILMQVSKLSPGASNPPIGQSGVCDDTHLLDLRNSPAQSTFLALVAPGLHSMLSVTSTTDEFGVAPDNNSVNVGFSEWWNDQFVQDLVLEGINAAGISASEIDGALELARHAALAADDIDEDRSRRTNAWYFLSRLYSIAADGQSLPPASRLALVCGVPPTDDGKIAAKDQLSVMGKIADALLDGFGTGIANAKGQGSDEDSVHLDAFQRHLTIGCELPTSFERAPQYYYSTEKRLTVSEIPQWWQQLTVKKWLELLTEDSPPQGEIVMSCLGKLIEQASGLPALVRDEVEISFEAVASEAVGTRVTLSRGKTEIGTVEVDTMEVSLNDDDVGLHKTPIRYVATADGFKPTAVKVISLERWEPGIYVACRHARKLIPPRKAASQSKGSTDYETSMTLPGKGRWELLVFTASGMQIASQATGRSDDYQGTRADAGLLNVREMNTGAYHLEFDADSNYRIEIPFTRDVQGSILTGRVIVQLTLEDVTEQGCRSELERLILVNRRRVEKTEKLVVQIDRNSRSSSLQDWMLGREQVAKSFQPMVIANDYERSWKPGEWGKGHGPVFSDGTFLHDPRPDFSEFNPPSGFVEARMRIAEYVRGSDENGLFESAELGRWHARDPEFAETVESYIDAYNVWLASDPDIACWVDVALVCSLDSDQRTINRAPDAVLLSPLHPLRVGWHVIAQRALFDADEDGKPCPAVSVLDPDCVPDLLTLALHSPSGLDRIQFLAVENGTDYWSVLWNEERLDRLPHRSAQAPFGNDFGISVGGISAGFSAGQVVRALDDVSGLIAAKPSVSVVVDSSEGTSDTCSEGIVSWGTSRFGAVEDRKQIVSAGVRTLDVYDLRDKLHRPNDATIANLSEDTNNRVRWFDKRPVNRKPDLGIIAQLDMAEPRTTDVDGRSPLGHGGLLRHRIRKQLAHAFTCETRQSQPSPPSHDALANKVAACIGSIEGQGERRTGMTFAPNINAIRNMLEDQDAQFVAASSSAIDPASFLGGWLEGAYLWDYDLPSYSRRSGDTNGYYLLSKVKASDKEALSRAVSRLPGHGPMDDKAVHAMLLEIARRGIPTIRGLAGDNSGATGDLGLFVASRLLQDRFRIGECNDSIVPILKPEDDGISLCLIVPVDPFRGFFGDLARSLAETDKTASLSRPDLLAIGAVITDTDVHLRLTPIEVKCRPNAQMSSSEANTALGQATTFSRLLQAMLPHEGQPLAWAIGFQHLMLSIIGFGMRVYGQHPDLLGKEALWSKLHERIAAAILAPDNCISIDGRGRLVIVDNRARTEILDVDDDKFDETIAIACGDAAAIISGDPKEFYSKVRARINDWGLLPALDQPMMPRGDIDPSAVDLAALQGEQIEISKDEYETVHTLASGNPQKHEQDGTVDFDMATDQVSSGVVLEVGQAIDSLRRENVVLNISDTRLNQLNMGVVGDLGTGKTQLLKSIIYQISSAAAGNRDKAPRLLIFDYKRDYSSPEFVEATGARVVKPWKLPLNLFDTRGLGETAAPWLDRFRFFTDVLDKIYSGVGPVQRAKLKQAVQSAYNSCLPGDQPTLNDVHAAYAEILDGKTDSPMAIIDDLIDLEIFAKDAADIITFDEFLDGVVVISLDALGQDDRTKNMVVAVMLNMFYENMLKTDKKPFVGTDPQLRAVDSFLLVDEADNIMRYEFDVLRKLLLQGREFGTGVILASQYLRHFKASTTDYREPLLTWFIHKVPNITPAELSALGLSGSAAEAAERIKTLDVHQCLFKSYDSPGEILRGKPFFELPIGSNSKI